LKKGQISTRLRRAGKLNQPASSILDRLAGLTDNVLIYFSTVLLQKQTRHDKAMMWQANLCGL